ncbi:diguanylate cyclase with PAS/PAC sensor [Thermanaerovibrio acidaminovorans DSM 6589]|uniref:Diguanylate cyclase with PAS/PAC sensor n=1 Tax=Thermanaerovibrio acidaminovorans (strain ATCC 49978 / DSM 6589 / Su883) TaxID=525903 RepID=D1B7I6_THEAS|nr:diguanylate cyclase with PAS/PAC sensor [Thermanaerovibrio acidaminovorans DSM 6589]
MGDLGDPRGVMDVESVESFMCDFFTRQEVYRIFFKESLVGAVFCSPRGLILDANTSMCGMLGQFRHTVVGRPIGDFLRKGSRNRIVGPLKRLMSGRSRNERVDCQLVKACGSLLEARVFISKVEDRDGMIRGYLLQVIDITDSKERERAIKAMAMKDPLTELPNRAACFEEIELAIMESSGGEDRFFALIFIDLDGFKEINDTLGHLMGDEALKEVARRLKSCVRASDTVSRIGGDEFVMIIKGLPCEEAAFSVVAKVASQFDSPVVLSGVNVRLGASLGVAIYPRDGRDSLSLMQRADEAMYLHKASKD